jgi:hypothetical protein
MVVTVAGAKPAQMTSSLRALSKTTAQQQWHSVRLIEILGQILSVGRVQKAAAKNGAESGIRTHVNRKGIDDFKSEFARLQNVAYPGKLNITSMIATNKFAGHCTTVNESRH